MEILYTVYWARSSEMTDVASEGYVGITLNLEARKHCHNSAIIGGDRGRFYSWARKHGRDAIVWDILHEGLTQAEALEVEARLRPDMNIGWNNQRGGELGVEPEWYEDEDNAEYHSARTSEATKLGIAINDTTEARSARAKKVWDCPEYRAKQSARQSGSANNCAGLYGDRHPASKINDDDRLLICQRVATGEMYKDVAEDFPVGKAQVRHLARTWGPKHGVPFTPRRARSLQKIEQL